MKRWLLAITLACALLGAGRAGTLEARGQSCIAWDREWFGEAADTRAAIDRLAPEGAPYGQLLNAWKADNCLRLNHIQVVGTHNSYHVRPTPALLNLVAMLSINWAVSFDYTHRPLAEQLAALEVRQIELDVFLDPAGGLYANPVGNLPPIGTGAPQPGMDEAGLKVLHSQDVDFRTTCRSFVLCLQQVKAWSDANPGHLPVLILVEAKDDLVPLPEFIPGIGPIPPAVVPIPFTAAGLDVIDEEIRSVFGPGDLMTPDDVRGTRATLEEAVLKDGWPTLNELRGRVFFALDNTDAKRDAYIAGHAALAGRVMFASSDPGTPEAAFVKLNNPVADFALIQDLVARGYIVRTRADEDTIEARFNVTGRRDAALASGAQFVSTDYPEPGIVMVPLPPSGPGPKPYMVDIPGPGRCNPVLSPPDCDSTMLE